MAEDDCYRELAAKIFMQDSALIPRLFSMLADPDEAELLLALPGTATGLAEKTGMEESRVQEMLDTLFHKGLVFLKRRPEGTVNRMCRDLMQFHDASILWPEAPRDFLDTWQEFMETEWPAFSETVDKLLPRPVTRIVPVGVAIDAKQQILAFEDVKQMVEETDTIAVTNCTCRLIAHKCDRPVEICLQLGKAASYAIERGTGRQIDSEEAVALLRKAEEAGLIHTTMNKTADTHFICNCCDDCCMVFPMIINKKLYMCDPSRYTAKVSVEACTGCGDCVERCFFDALLLAEDGGTAVVSAEECMGCGLCQVACPEDAITLEVSRESDFIPS